MMKQRWGLDRNVLRPTPGDPWGVEQHHWNTGAEENQQLNPGGPSNRRKPTLEPGLIQYQYIFSTHLENLLQHISNNWQNINSSVVGW